MKRMKRLPDAGEGLHNRVAKAAREECSVDAILAAGKVSAMLSAAYAEW